MLLSFLLMHTPVDSYFNIGCPPRDHHHDNRSYSLVTTVTTTHNHSTINPLLEDQSTGEEQQLICNGHMVICHYDPV